VAESVGLSLRAERHLEIGATILLTLTHGRVTVDGAVGQHGRQVFVDLDASKQVRLFIDSRYADPPEGESKEKTFPLEYFFRFYTPTNDRFHDTPVERDRIRVGTDVFHLQKVQRGPETADFTGRNCLIFFYPQPARRILISKIRIYSI